jgi:hypothetical protein
MDGFRSGKSGHADVHTRSRTKLTHYANGRLRQPAGSTIMLRFLPTYYGSKYVARWSTSPPGWRSSVTCPRLETELRPPRTSAVGLSCCNRRLDLDVLAVERGAGWCLCRPDFGARPDLMTGSGRSGDARIAATGCPVPTFEGVAQPHLNGCGRSRLPCPAWRRSASSRRPASRPSTTWRSVRRMISVLSTAAIGLVGV